MKIKRGLAEGVGNGERREGGERRFLPHVPSPATAAATATRPLRPLALALLDEGPWAHVIQTKNKGGET